MTLRNFKRISVAALEPEVPQKTISLVYVSSAVKLMSEEQVLDILRISRRNNESLDVTGMLLYKDGNFMQVLEGPEQVVEELSRKIERDPRHKGFLRLLKRDLGERQFPDWSMGYKNLNGVPEQDLATFTPFLQSTELDQQFATGAHSQKLLSTFKRTHR